MTCLSCGGETKPWLSTPIDCKKNEPTPYGNVVRCIACGMGSLSPVPPAAEIAALYDLPQYYTHGEGHIKSRRGNIFERLLVKLAAKTDKSRMFRPEEIAKLLPAGASICDLGCGNAAFLQEFVKMGFACVGVDPDPNARSEAVRGGVTVLDGTADATPEELDGQTYDLVIMTHALEHCRDPHAAVLNAYKLTKTSGLCYIEVPNSDCEHFRRFTICSENFEAPRHIHFFSLNALKSLVTRIGFSVVEPRFVYYDRNFDPGRRDWECEIADRMSAAQAKAVKHTFFRSIALFLSSFWRSPDRKYDSFGLMLTR